MTSGAEVLSMKIILLKVSLIAVLIVSISLNASFSNFRFQGIFQLCLIYHFHLLSVLIYYPFDCGICSSVSYC